MVDELAPTTLVIFGVSGDLSRRYLLPALSEICQNSAVRAHLEILGISRRRISASEVLNDKLANLADNFQLLTMDYNSSAEYRKLQDELEKQGKEQVIFYLAVPPEAGLPIVNKLAEANLNGPRFKLLLEKPFGRDLNSARKLIKETSRCFREEQIYRIDHYLAKEMAQNIAVFLGANALFRDVWNNQFIEKIEIVALESIGIEGRGNFYESTGALRDIVQSHLLQLTALILMRPCEDFSELEGMPKRRLEVLKDLRLSGGKSCVTRGQYKGYKEEAGNPDSATETFISLLLVSGNPKWAGVPIRLTTGKNLDQKLTEVQVHFKKANASEANLLRLRIQPKEGIELDLWVKKPGYDQDLQILPLDFVYNQHFGRLPDAYEQVIVDAMRSRANLFASSEEVLASWKILQPVLAGFDKGQPELKIYKPGSTAEEILANT